MFPSHIGSRSTTHRKDAGLHNQGVSIPHWFSLNHPAWQDVRDLNWFPSHIGSRSTITPYPEVASQSLCFHPTLVLAQPTYPPKDVTLLFSFPSHIGSRSTTSPTKTSRGSGVFPSHIGSRSTHTPSFIYLFRLSGFHPTLVLAQPDADEESLFFDLKFPSHIGSRSTRPQGA